MNQIKSIIFSKNNGDEVLEQSTPGSNGKENEGNNRVAEIANVARGTGQDGGQAVRGSRSFKSEQGNGKEKIDTGRKGEDEGQDNRDGQDNKPTSKGSSSGDSKANERKSEVKPEPKDD